MESESDLKKAQTLLKSFGKAFGAGELQVYAGSASVNKLTFAQREAKRDGFLSFTLRNLSYLHSDLARHDQISNWEKRAREVLKEAYKTFKGIGVNVSFLLTDGGASFEMTESDAAKLFSKGLDLPKPMLALAQKWVKNRLEEISPGLPTS